MDTTCLKANIHHPVDWLLLRDGTRTLIKAIKLIRKHGLKHRMQNPDSFLTDDQPPLHGNDAPRPKKGRQEKAKDNLS
jgi:hypothetical protein